MQPQIQHWIIFALVVLVALVLDLVVFHRKAQKISLPGALLESAGWIGVALCFNLWVYHVLGPRAGVEFLTGYLIEKSLSVDNIFVFILIFHAFGVPARSHHKVLYYGVVGALVLRAIFVFAGVELLQLAHALEYVFGGFLLFTGVHMILPGERVIHPERNWLVRVTRRFVPVLTNYDGENFLVQRDHRWHATPLFLALVAVEAMDIILAVDSVPAVLAITRDPFIVYSSNTFAILGLRALYFALTDVLPRFRFLHQGLALIVIFVGGKMITGNWKPISTVVSLGIIALVLLVTVLASLAFPQRKKSSA